MKDELFSVFHEHFKPRSSLDPERVEYNEKNFFSEFQLYNLVFAKNDLLYDDHKSAILLNVFWRLLEFNVPDQSPSPSASPTRNLEVPLNQLRINTTSTVDGGGNTRSRTQAMDR